MRERYFQERAAVRARPPAREAVYRAAGGSTNLLRRDLQLQSGYINILLNSSSPLTSSPPLTTTWLSVKSSVYYEDRHSRGTTGLLKKKKKVAQKDVTCNFDIDIILQSESIVLLEFCTLLDNAVVA